MQSVLTVSRINEKDLTKLYYPIGEVAKMFDVNTSLIRFWEKEFPNVKPKKNKKGNRLFTPKEILKLDRIFHLVKERGYTLEGAKKALREKEDDLEMVSVPAENPGNDQEELIRRLEKVRSQLLSMKS